MLFIGNGSLLRHALVSARQNSIKIDLVCVNNDEGLVQFCQRLNVPVLVSSKLNTDLIYEVSRSSDGVALSVNNSLILGDELLSTELKFFNIHNGLVQKYRGIAEVCVLAAICKSEVEYGSTLHQLLPKQEVDSGPVFDQRSFNLEQSENFETIFSMSIQNYKSQLELMLPRLASLTEHDGDYMHGLDHYSYKDIPNIISTAPAERRELACSVGKYSGLLPRLSGSIRDTLKNLS